MKLSWGIFFSSLYGAACATNPNVSPETARLIIAQRLGLSRFHSFEHVDADSLRHINAYGGLPQKLFGQGDADKSKAHLLMWIEDGDVEAATGMVYDGSYDGSDRVSRFTISSAPSPADNNRLIQDFVSQAESLPEPLDPKKRTYKAAFEIESLLPANTTLHTYNEYLNIFRVNKNDNITGENMHNLLISVLEKAKEVGFAVTTVTMPAPAAHAKRVANSWGTYALPGANGARRENPEALLSLNSVPSSSPAPPVSDLEDFPIISALANDKGPVRGILPNCFKSQSACEKQTHNCSSHGECKLLHKGRGEGKDRQTLDCYGCACVPTKEHVGEDKGMESKQKVTYWGGPACQKKDISVQFWLFVATGVVLAFLVSSGIGMLYSMGSEELPSVIGAGVSGPVRK